jgi:hypothetical protein
MEDHYGRKPSHSSVLDWARALGSVRWTIPPRERRLIAVDWNKATWSRSSMDALLFLSRVLEACTNKPVFVVEGGPWYSWAFRELGLEHCRGALGDRSGVEMFFGSLKRRTSAFFKDINAGRSRIASLDMLMNLFFVYYNGLRFQEGIGRVPSEVIAVLG